MLRSSSGWFLVQSIILYTAGIKLFMYLNVNKGVPAVAVNVLCLVVCLPAVILSAEIFHRAVDFPSQQFAHIVFDWIRE